MRFFLGLDLGQATDFTAMAVLEKMAGEGKPYYHLRMLERLQLKTAYPDVIQHVKQLLEAEPLDGQTLLVLDQTGVGRPVYDLFKQARLRPVGVTITAGGKANHIEWDQWRVPKRDLVAVTKVLLQSGRLHIAKDLELAPTFAKELLAFRLKVNAATMHESYESWRDGVHDDLVLAVALACWFAEAAWPPAAGTSGDRAPSDLVADGTMGRLAGLLGRESLTLGRRPVW